MYEQNMNDSIILAPRYNLRIDHFGAEHCLRLTCGVCDHTGTISGQNLRRRYQPYERIALLQAGFTCTKCGTTGHATWRVEELR